MELRSTAWPLLLSIAMKRNGIGPDLVVDFLVPACLASRYRAQLTALSPFEAELRLSFCPSIFRSGALSCCPAEISAVSGGASVRVRGSFRLEGGGSGTTARFRFDPPIARHDFQVLSHAGPEDLELCSVPGSAADPAIPACPSEPEAGWASSATAH